MSSVPATGSPHIIAPYSPHNEDDVLADSPRTKPIMTSRRGSPPHHEADHGPPDISTQSVQTQQLQPSNLYFALKLQRIKSTVDFNRVMDEIIRAR